MIEDIIANDYCQCLEWRYLLRHMRNSYSDHEAQKALIAEGADRQHPRFLP